jgi:superfamily I DNA and/or RNA helicase
VLINYVKIFLILIDDEIQLRFVVLSISNNNEFVYLMKMFFFHRLELFHHLSIMLRVQYRMINIMKNMISNLFYDEKFVNDLETNISSRSFTQVIMQYVQDR